MKDLALHILDIVQNSITAGAKLIEITIMKTCLANMIGITIRDNGKGIHRKCWHRLPIRM
jgi:DNA mismatch repair ATPase MutL